MPVLVAAGVTDADEKRLLALQLMGSESRAAWRTLELRNLEAYALVQSGH